MAHSSSRRKRDKSSSRSRSSRSSPSSSSSRSSSPSSSSSGSSKSRSRSRSKSKTKSKASRSSSRSSTHSSRSGKSNTSKGARRRSPSPANRIHINRLTRNVNKNHLYEIFNSYGSVKSVDLPMDKNHPHLGRGIAMVEFEKSEDAEKAMRYMDGGQIDGQEIAVSKMPFRAGIKPKGGPNRNGGRRRF